MKKCTHCEVVKEDSAFRIDRSKARSLQSWCGKCQDATKKTPEGKERAKKVAQKYRRTEKGRATRRRGNQKYRASSACQANKIAYKLSHREYLKTKRKKYWASESGKEARKRIRAKYKSNPENMAKIIARRRVQSALESGRLIRPTRCSSCLKLCEKPRELHAHHFKGYDQSHWLDVEWVCNLCHPKICPSSNFLDQCPNAAPWTRANTAPTTSAASCVHNQTGIVHTP